MDVFSGDEVQEFITNGFVYLRNAFSPSTAERCRDIVWDRIEQETKGEIRRGDPTSWTKREKLGLRDVYTREDGEPWTSVLSERLFQGISQLVPDWNREDFGCGWWVIGFPMEQENRPKEWGPIGHWHVDGAHFEHFADSKEQGLLPIFIMNDLRPGDGGTALAVGSHVHVASVLLEEYPNGLSSREVAQRALTRMPGVLDQIVEVNGNAGDVVLTHPFLLHARSTNLGKDVRFMCNPSVKLVNKMDLEAEDVSPLEKAIQIAKQRCEVPFSFGKQRPTKKRRKW